MMLNQASVEVYDADLEKNHSPKIGLQKTQSFDSASLKKKKGSKSPGTARRLLPSTPSFLKNNKEISKSTDDVKSEPEKHESLTAKFKYNSLPRRKKDSKSRSAGSSTFYTTDQKPSPQEQRRDSRNETIKEVSETSNNGYQTMKRKESKESKTQENGHEKQTHVALYKFYARHKDELPFIDGDPIQVIKMFDDLWYEGINLATGKQGVFPCRYVADIMLREISSGIEEPSDHRQFQMRFLGSVEVLDCKGDEVLCYAIAKVVNQRSMLSTSNPPSCFLQVSTRGIRICMIENDNNQDIDRKAKKGKTIEKYTINEEASHHFALKNVTFCGNHPKDRRYFGFITKHPDEYRFACHIFMSKYSTDEVAKVVGNCFETFYEKYLEYRAPTEDLYIE